MNDNAYQAMAETHEVFNLPQPLENYNLFRSDVALQQAVKREGAAPFTNIIDNFGALTGSAEVTQWGFQANKVKPEFRTHDRYGRRVDEVDFHPAYHHLMRTSIENGLHAIPWTEQKPGANVYRAALSFMMSQVDAGHGCPITMTFAAIPTLQKQPEIAAQWAPLITSRVYDPTNKPYFEKQGVTQQYRETDQRQSQPVLVAHMPLAGPEEKEHDEEKRQ